MVKTSHNISAFCNTITQTFNTEMAVLNAREDFDILLCCNETVLLPLSDIQIVNVAGV